MQFLKLGIVACESINTIFIAANQSQFKVPKNLFGSVLPDFPVVSIIAFLVTMEIVVKKYVIESRELCISRFLPVSTPAVPRVDPSMCRTYYELLNVFRRCKHRRPRQNQVDFALNINQS